MTMRSLIQRERALERPFMLLLGVALLLCTPFALAQNNLGELLDAGAKKLSAEQFKAEVVQHVVVGPTESGGNLELMYASNGLIQGKGNSVLFSGVTLAEYNGEWNTDEQGRVCAGMGVKRQHYPFRCQFWFKYKEHFFLSDSDTDRSTKVFVRTVKP